MLHSLDIAELLLRLFYALIGLSLELLNLTEESLPLSFGVEFLLGELVNIFVFLVNLVQVEVARADFVDGFNDVLLHRVVVERNFCYFLVYLYSFKDLLSHPLLDQVVAQTQDLQSGELALEHFEEIL